MAKTQATKTSPSSIFSLQGSPCLTRLFLPILLVGFLTGLLPNILAPVVEKVFSPQIINLSVLLQPVGAVIWGLGLGIPTLPGFVAWIGLPILVVGLFLIKEELATVNSGRIAVDEDKYSNDSITGNPKYKTERDSTPLC